MKKSALVSKISSLPLISWLSNPWERIRPKLTRRRIKIAALILVALFILIPLTTYAYYARDIDNRERLMNRNNTGIILKDRSGTAFYSSGVLSTKDDLPLSAISDNVEKAVIASEDKDFYKHNGFSIRGTVRAFVGNISSRDVSASGGSTITQQLVKNKLLGAQKNYLRKYQELAMAIAVERHYTKNEILEMYLNAAYFGNGAFGISDAAQTYFGKEASELTLSESSMLVGLLPAPSSYSPITGDVDLAKAAQQNVLRKMVATNKITSAQKEEAQTQQLTYANKAKNGGADYAQHFADMIIDELEEKYGEERVKRSGFEVTTTIDLGKQKLAEQHVREHVARTARLGGKNAGLVSIDPKTGQVLALVGSVDYYNKEFGQVNMATALRQPGSSFKPIYYSDAIDRGLITAATILNDKPTTFGGTYSPKNFDNRYRGNMAVRNALAESRNVPAVQVMQKEGISDAAKAAQRMGIDTINNPETYGLSLALGTAEVKLIQTTSAYGAFANEGKHISPQLFTKIADKFGKTVVEAKTPKPKRVLDPETAYIMSSILSDPAARAPTSGTSLNIPGKVVALKTGTTNDNRDAWTIGYTPSVVTGVWLGNNENQPMRGLAGGSGAGALWKRVMTSYLSSSRREEFKKPSSVVTLAICAGTELRAAGGSKSGTRTEHFKRGTEPKSTCNAKEDKEDKNKKQENEDEKPDNEGNQQNNNSGQGNSNGNDSAGDDQTGDDNDDDDDGSTQNPPTPPTNGPGTTTPPQPRTIQ